MKRSLLSIGMGVLWFAIALPYVPFFRLLTRRWISWPVSSVWSGVATGVIVAFIAAFMFFGTTRFRYEAFQTAPLTGGVLSLVLFGIFQKGLLHFSGDEVLEIVAWNVIAGIICAALLRDIGIPHRSKDRTAFRRRALILWVIILRIGQLAVFADMDHSEDIFGEEVLTLVPVLMWSWFVFSPLLHKKIGSRQLILWAIFYGFLTLEVSAISIVPISILTGGHFGVQAALGLMAIVPGPGIVWGIAMTYFTRSRLQVGLKNSESELL
jgi:hypothetical protein